MPTKANILIKDADSQLLFYRPHDGKPEDTLPLLEMFLQYIKDGKIKDNVSQAAGWLILFGTQEHLRCIGKVSNIEHAGNPRIQDYTPDSAVAWSVGLIEPATQFCYDIGFLYVIDLVKKTIKTTTVYSIAHVDRIREKFGLKEKKDE